MTALDAAELDEHIARLPPLVDDPAYLVFADWLQSKGHPWGELIMLQHRAAHATSKAEAGEFTLEADIVLEQRRAEILGELPAGEHDLEWHLGFLRRAHLRMPTEQQVVLDTTKSLVLLPCARMLDSLVLDPRPTSFATTQDWTESRSNVVDPWPDWDDFGPLVYKHNPVPHIAFGAWPASPESAYVQMPSFDTISRWLRSTLRRLTITGSWSERSEAFDLPNLVELELHFADATADALGRITVSELPSLQRLTVSLGGGASCILDDVYGDEYPDEFTASDLAIMTVPGVRPAIRGGEVMRRFLDELPPEVNELSFTSSVLDPALLANIVLHPRVWRLKKLDLSACTISDETVPLLIEAPQRFRQIGAIDLSRNAFTDRFRSRLATALPTAKLGDTSQSRPDFFMRYVATME